MIHLIEAEDGWAVMKKKWRTYRAYEEDDGKGHQCIFPTNGSRHGGRAKGPEECASLEDGDDIGIDLVCFVLVNLTTRVGDTEVDLEIRLGHDASTNATRRRCEGHRLETGVNKAYVS